MASTVVRGTKQPEKSLTLGVSDLPMSQSPRESSSSGVVIRKSFGDKVELLSFGHRRAPLRRAVGQTESSSRLDTSELHRAPGMQRALRRESSD
eukprot:3538621-Alexandrium_andersonii.AAC.1